MITDAVAPVGPHGVSVVDAPAVSLEPVGGAAAVTDAADPVGTETGASVVEASAANSLSGAALTAEGAAAGSKAVAGTASVAVTGSKAAGRSAAAANAAQARQEAAAMHVEVPLKANEKRVIDFRRVRCK